MSPGIEVARVFDASTLEVPVPLDDGQLEFVDVPGSTATVIAGTLEATGTVARTGGEIDPLTQLVEIVVVLGDAPDAFVPGRFVEVVVAGRHVQDVARLPRRAVRRTESGGDTVSVADSNSQLQYVQVEVVRRDGDNAYVRGLSQGDRVILTPLDLATQGMPVQVEGEEEPVVVDDDAEATS